MKSEGRGAVEAKMTADEKEIREFSRVGEEVAREAGRFLKEKPGPVFVATKLGRFPRPGKGR